MDRNALLHIVLVLPLLGAAAVGVLGDARVARAAALGITGVVFGIVLAMAIHAGRNPVPGFAYLFETKWMRIGEMRVEYRVGADGISLALAALTALLSLLCVVHSWESVRERAAGYYACLLVLETGMLGVFFALDLFLFYVFWEVSLIPMYFLIGMWGGPRRVYAALKFVLFTVAGSLLMLVAAIWVYAKSGTFDMTLIPERMGGDAPAQMLPFLAFALAFAVKVPMVPFHTWLPDAHVEAPTAGSVLLAGILLKMGVYGFVRIAIPFFPEAARAAAPWMLLVAATGAVYGALMAMVQTDIKKLIAYSSVSHMGFVMLGLFAFHETAAQGAVLQSLNHGISTGALFFLVGMLYDRAHARGVHEFGGLARIMPGYAAAFLVIALSSIGLPGTNGFVGEFLILAGTFRSGGTLERVLVAVTGTAIVLGAVYLLGMYRHVFFGPERTTRWRGLRDAGLLDWAVLLPLIVLVFAIGIRPGLVLDLTKDAWRAIPNVIAHGP
jgi:NADH-quinone oxidoreductase subunit M